MIAGTLLQKELRQNWPSYLLLCGILCVASLICGVAFNADGSGAGAIWGVGLGLWIFLPIAGFIVGHLLIAEEYRHRTQLFLEGLPIPRWQMIGLKLALAISIGLLLSALAVSIGVLMGLQQEMLTPTYLGIIYSSAAGWSLFCVILGFIISFLGRYRIMAIMLLLIALLIMHQHTSVPIGEFSPYALISRNRFGLEREVWPVADLLMTALIVGIGVIVAFALGLVREGSVGAMLGEKMSYRESTFMTGLAFVVVFFALSQTGGNDPEPFDVPGAVAETYAGVEVYVSPEVEGEPVDAEIAMAARLARRLAELRDWFGIEQQDFPRIYIVEKTDIDEPEVIDPWEKVADPTAVLMYAAYQDEQAFSEARLLAWTMSSVLHKLSMERVGQEDRWWIVCGLEGLWEMDGASEAYRRERTQLAATAVKKHGLGVENLLGWSKYQDDAEWRSADAVAWLGMELLRERVGTDVVQKLARATTVQKVTRADGRAVLWDYTHPVVATFGQVTGLELEAFVDDWRESILEHAPDSDDGEEVDSL